MKKSTATGSRSFSKRQAFFCPDPITRPHYFAGALLSVDDFTSEQNYHREKQRRHNLHCHGYGIVEGLKVSIGHAGMVTIEPGVAIDPAGNEIELCGTARLPLPELPATIQVGIRLLERLSAPVPSPSDPASPGSQFSRTEEGCEVLLSPVSRPRRRPGKGKGLEILPGIILPLAHLVRLKGVWRVSRKFKVPRAH